MHYPANQLCKCARGTRNPSLTVAELQPFSGDSGKLPRGVCIGGTRDGGVFRLLCSSQRFKVAAINLWVGRRGHF